MTRICAPGDFFDFTEELECLIPLSVKTRDEQISNLPSLGGLCIISILTDLSLPRLRILYECAFLFVELAQHTYCGIPFELAPTLSLPLLSVG